MATILAASNLYTELPPLVLLFGKEIPTGATTHQVLVDIAIHITALLTAAKYSLPDRK